jgi:hypothetical protein
MYLAVKKNIGTARIVIRYHIIAVSWLGAFDQNSKEELGRILNTKVKKTINIWGKRLVVAALKGSFAIWLKKCRYNNPVCIDQRTL